jgi:hypothetical protein
MTIFAIPLKAAFNALKAVIPAFTPVLMKDDILR